jgi:hypothetical protein
VLVDGVVEYVADNTVPLRAYTPLSPGTGVGVGVGAGVGVGVGVGVGLGVGVGVGDEPELHAASATADVNATKRTLIFDFFMRYPNY